jgi:hypothetical protein
MNDEEFRLFIACKMRGSEESSFESSFGGEEKMKNATTKEGEEKNILSNLPLPELASGTKSCSTYMICTTAIFIEFPILASA